MCWEPHPESWDISRCFGTSIHPGVLLPKEYSKRNYFSTIISECSDPFNWGIGLLGKKKYKLKKKYKETPMQSSYMSYHLKNPKTRLKLECSLIELILLSFVCLHPWEFVCVAQNRFFFLSFYFSSGKSHSDALQTSQDYPWLIQQCSDQPRY